MHVLNLKFGYFWGWVFPYIRFFVGEGSSILGTLWTHVHLLGEVNGETDSWRLRRRVSGVLQENQVLLVGLRDDTSQVRDYNDYKDLL